MNTQDYRHAWVAQSGLNPSEAMSVLRLEHRQPQYWTLKPPKRNVREVIQRWSMRWVLLDYRQGSSVDTMISSSLKWPILSNGDAQRQNL